MIVRSAGACDLPRILEMAARFYEQTSYSKHADFDPEAITNLAVHLKCEGVLLVAMAEGQIVGMVGLLIAPLPFNPASVFAHEVMWWVEPEARGLGAGKALLRAAEDACRDAGVDAIQMVHLSSSPPEAAAIYQRAGYAHTESSFTKGL